MIVGVLGLELRLPEARSLKDKRRVLTSLQARLRRRFGVSVAEIGHEEAWRTALLGVACVSSSSGVCRRLLDEVVRFCESAGPFEVIEARVEMR